MWCDVFTCFFLMPAPPRKVLQHPRGLRRHRREVSVAVAAMSQSTSPSKNFLSEGLTKFVPERVEANHTKNGLQFTRSGSMASFGARFRNFGSQKLNTSLRQMLQYWRNCKNFGTQQIISLKVKTCTVSIFRLVMAQVTILK